MAVILPGAGDYESALRLMGEASALGAFAEGRERNLQMQDRRQRMALQRQAAEQRQDEINRKRALESAGFTEEMLASALSGGGGATGGGGRRRASSAGPALDYEAASLQEALAADAAEAQAASTQRMRELDAAQMALAKQLPVQAALEREVEAGAARQRLLSGPPSYTASRMEQAELEGPVGQVSTRFNPWTEGGAQRAAAEERQANPWGLKPGTPQYEAMMEQRLADALTPPAEATKDAVPADPLRMAIQRAGRSRGPEVQSQRKMHSGMPKDEGTILVGSDLLKDVSEEDVLSAGGRKVTDAAGKTGYWLPAGGEIGLAKSGPVDDTAEGEGFLQGRLASANRRLSEQTAKTNTLRSAVRRLKKKSGDQLVNPWERFGKPATFMPSIRATSFAVQRAKDGDPSLISQMIGRQLYPSELRDLERLTSDYQDFAGGVRAKATEITKSRKTAAQEAADAEAMGIANKYASLATGLVAGSRRKGMSQEEMDIFSDTIGAIATKDPKAAMDMAKLYAQMGKDEWDRWIESNKNRGKGTGPGGIGDKVARTEHRHWTKMLNGVEDDIRNSLMKRDKELVMWISDKKGPDGTPMLKKNAPPGVKTMYENAKAGLGGLLRQRADHLKMVNRYATVLGLGAAPTDSGDAGDSEEEKVAAFIERMKGLKRAGGDGSLHDVIAEAGDAELQKWRDGMILETSNPRLVDAAIASIRSAKVAARGGEPAPPVDMKRIPLTKEERAAQRAERARLAEEERRGEAERATATGMSLAKRINDGEDVTLSEVREAVEAMKKAPSEESEVILQELDAYNREKIDRLVDAEIVRTRLLSPR